MTTSDWIAGGALVVALATALRQWWFERRQARLTELQIAEHEDRAAEKAVERARMELSEQFVRSFAVPRVKEFTEDFASMSPEEQDELLRQADELNDPDKDR